MTVLKAHFDGKVLVPDEPVNLPTDCALRLHVEPLATTAKESSPKKQPSHPGDEKPLMRLLKTLEELPHNPDWPSDGAAQVDHYLYGQPKRP